MTKYYVDFTLGSDSANGLSPSTAWKTLAKAQSGPGGGYLSGDKILLKAGETWIATSSTVTPEFTFPAPNITLGRYGEGARPIIDGQHLVRILISTGSNAGTITENLHLKNGGYPGTGDSTGSLWGGDAVGTSILRDCKLETHDTDCLASGGGTGVKVVIRRCEFTGAGDEAVTLHNSANGLIQNCTFRNNRSAMNHAGGVITSLVEDCIFEDNGDGANSFGDLDGLEEGTHVFNRCKFLGRADGAGFAFMKQNVGTTTFNYCLFDASRAGSISAAQFAAIAPTYLNNCVFYGGASANGMLIVNSGITLTATNCIFANWWNAAFGSGAGDWSPSPDGIFNAINCIFYTVTSKHVTSNVNQITSDPLFTDTAARDFSLQAGSPALSSGINLGIFKDLNRKLVSNPPDRGAVNSTMAGSVGSTISPTGITICTGAGKVIFEPLNSSVDTLVQYTSGSGAVSTANIAAAEVGGMGGSWSYISGRPNPLTATTIESESVTRFWPLICAGNKYQSVNRVIQFNLNGDDNNWEGLKRSLPAGHQDVTLTMMVKDAETSNADAMDIALINATSGAYAILQGYFGTFGAHAGSPTHRGRHIARSPSQWYILELHYKSDGTAEGIVINNDTGAVENITECTGGFAGVDALEYLLHNYLTFGGGTLRIAMPAVSLAGTFPLSPIAIPNPTSVLSTQSNSGTITLTWNGVTQRYKIERSSNAGSTWSTIAANFDTVTNTTSGDASLTYIDSGLTNGTAYLYRVTALGAGRQSNAVNSNSTTINNATVPTTNLKLWLKADAITGADNSIPATWTDSSPEGNNATNLGIATLQTNELNGKPVVRVSGGDAFRGTFTNPIVNTSGNGAVTSFAVFKMSASSESYARILSLSGGGTGNDYNNVVTVIPILRDATNQRIGGFRNSSSLVNADIVYDTAVIVRSRFDGTNFNTWINGVAGTPAASTGDLNITNYGVGINSGANDGYLTGDIAEIIVYDANISDGTCQGIEDYLSSKYGISVTH